jgi:hypothetical protein
LLAPQALPADEESRPPALMPLAIIPPRQADRTAANHHTADIGPATPAR